MDLYIFQKINEFAFKWFWLDVLAIFFAKYFEYFLIISVLLFLVMHFKNYWKIIIQAILAAILSRFFITEIIYQFFPRSRPFVELPVNLLLNHSPTASFPSGHAAFYFAIATVIFRYNKKAGILFFAGSFLISISRIFVGLHWLSDVLGGFLIGIISGLIITFLFPKVFPNLQKRLQQLK